MEKSKRLSGIELLRIIAMVQIIFLHLFQYGKMEVALSLKNLSASTVVDFMWSLSRTPVNVFVMISGYFLITAKTDIRRAVERCKKPYQAMLFYSVVIGIIFFITTPKLFVAPEVWKMCLPFFSRTWYFLDNYIIVLLISPFLNRMLVSLEKKEYRFLLIVAFVVVSVWSTLSKIKVINDVISTVKVTDNYYGKSLMGFLLMYIIGGYLRLHIDDSRFVVWKKRCWYGGIFLGMCGIDFALHCNFKEYKSVYGMFNNPFVVIESVCMILLFRSLVFSSKMVNTLASTTLGVYAIHEHPYVRKWLWELLSMKDHTLYHSRKYLPRAIGICVGVFLACGILELIRMKMFEFITKRHFIQQKDTTKK